MVACLVDTRRTVAVEEDSSMPQVAEPYLEGEHNTLAAEEGVVHNRFVAFSTL